MAEVELSHPRCPYCHAPVRPPDSKTACDACMSWQHTECWHEHSGCAACGGKAALSASTPRVAAKVAVVPRPEAPYDRRTHCTECRVPCPCGKHLRVRCGGSCPAQFDVPNRLRGKRIGCDRCRKKVQVPGWDVVHLPCPGRCGCLFKIPRRLVGKSIRCDFCARELRVPDDRARA